MSRMRGRAALLAAGLLVGGLLAGACERAGTPPPQDTGAAAPPAQEAPAVPEAAAKDEGPLAMPLPINAVMVSLVDFAADGIWRPPVQDAPMTDRQWKLAEKDTVDLVVAATLITTAGTGVNDSEWVKDADWRRWSFQMQQVGLAARAAVASRDQGALKTAGDELIEICEACHKKFKPGLPSMGLTRFPAYPKYPDEPLPAELLPAEL